jgi:excinuclease ABC subunit A
VLEVKLHGKSISDLLDMPIGDAVSLFADHPRIVHILQTICDVGLDYVTLGQSAPTLSGGEAQRIKLAAELARPDTGRTVYLLDEPTTGLHFNDIIKLMSVLQRLVDLGNSVIVIEHNLDVIKAADWVIDVGPDAGSRGGLVVAEGPPEAVVAAALAAKAQWDQSPSNAENLPLRSVTGEYLAPLLDQQLVQAHLDGRAAALVPSRIDSPAAAAAAKRSRRAKPVPSSRTASVNGSAHPAAELSSVAVSGPGAGAAIVAEQPMPPTEVDLHALRQQAQPWKILGRRWHSLGKGFPGNGQPDWPLELAEKALAMLEGIAGEDRLAFDAPDRVAVRGLALGETWAEVETKATDSVRVTLAGPAEAIDLDLLERLGIDGPVDLQDVSRTRVTLNLTDLKHVRSRNLKAFLKNHWQRSYHSKA